MKLVPRTLSVLAAAGLTALAPGISYGVPSYGNIDNPPGVYFGSGNVNGDWTIDTSNGVEVALRAKDRATLATIDGSSGVYHADPGLCNPVCSGGPKAAWNYELSVNLREGGGTLSFFDVFVELAVDTDRSAGVSFNFVNVLSNWPDAYYWDGTGPRRVGSTPVAGEYGVQQSANPLFGDSGFMPGFNLGAGLYDLRLSVYDAPSPTANLLARTTIQVQVPEPATLLLLGMGLAGLGFTARRRRPRN